jgi:hypothetical protein
MTSFRRYPDRPHVYMGLGQPPIGPLPWTTRAERREELLGKATTWIGIVGSVLGAVLAYRALTGKG